MRRLMVLATLRDGKAAGLSVENVAATLELDERFTGYAVPTERLFVNVGLIFDELP